MSHIETKGDFISEDPKMLCGSWSPWHNWIRGGEQCWFSIFLNIELQMPSEAPGCSLQSTSSWSFCTSVGGHNFHLFGLFFVVLLLQFPHIRCHMIDLGGKNFFLCVYIDKCEKEMKRGVCCWWESRAFGQSWRSHFLANRKASAAVLMMMRPWLTQNLIS